MGLPRSTVVKNPPANAGDTKDAGSISGLGKSPGGGNGNLLQYSCLENPMDKGAWQASPWGCKELDATEQLSKHNTHFVHMWIYMFLISNKVSDLNSFFFFFWITKLI